MCDLIDKGSYYYFEYMHNSDLDYGRGICYTFTYKYVNYVCKSNRNYFSYEYDRYSAMLGRLIKIKGNEGKKIVLRYCNDEEFYKKNDSNTITEIITRLGNYFYYVEHSISDLDLGEILSINSDKYELSEINLELLENHYNNIYK